MPHYRTILLGAGAVRHLKKGTNVLAAYGNVEYDKKTHETRGADGPLDRRPEDVGSGVDRFQNRHLGGRRRAGVFYPWLGRSRSLIPVLVFVQKPTPDVSTPIELLQTRITNRRLLEPCPCACDVETNCHLPCSSC